LGRSEGAARTQKLLRTVSGSQLDWGRRSTRRSAGNGEKCSELTSFGDTPGLFKADRVSFAIGNPGRKHEPSQRYSTLGWSLPLRTASRHEPRIHGASSSVFGWVICPSLTTTLNQGPWGHSRGNCCGWVTLRVP